MFLIDKYRPCKKEDSEFHNDVLDMLEIMSKDSAIPHLILYGPDGSGKRTIINIFLEMLFGEDIKHTKDTTAMTVDTAGRVLTPARPHCFFVFDSTATGGYTSVDSGAVLPFASAKVNVGGGTYDSSNYRYTVPITEM